MFTGHGIENYIYWVMLLMPPVNTQYNITNYHKFWPKIIHSNKNLHNFWSDKNKILASGPPVKGGPEKNNFDFKKFLRN